jgi:hypothetical protein
MEVNNEGNITLALENVLGNRLCYWYMLKDGGRQRRRGLPLIIRLVF